MCVPICCAICSGFHFIPLFNSHSPASFSVACTPSHLRSFATFLIAHAFISHAVSSCFGSSLVKNSFHFHKADPITQSVPHTSAHVISESGVVFHFVATSYLAEASPPSIAEFITFGRTHLTNPVHSFKIPSLFGHIREAPMPAHTSHTFDAVLVGS